MQSHTLDILKLLWLKESLKVVSTTFLLVCFLSLQENTRETGEKNFYFTSKALFILVKIKF